MWRGVGGTPKTQNGQRGTTQSANQTSHHEWPEWPEMFSNSRRCFPLAHRKALHRASTPICATQKCVQSQKTGKETKQNAVSKKGLLLLNDEAFLFGWAHTPERRPFFVRHPSFSSIFPGFAVEAQAKRCHFPITLAREQALRGSAVVFVVVVIYCYHPGPDPDRRRRLVFPLLIRQAFFAPEM